MIHYAYKESKVINPFGTLPYSCGNNPHSPFSHWNIPVRTPLSCECRPLIHFEPMPLWKSSTDFSPQIIPSPHPPSQCLTEKLDQLQFYLLSFAALWQRWQEGLTVGGKNRTKNLDYQLQNLYSTFLLIDAKYPEHSISFASSLVCMGGAGSRIKFCNWGK